jgi:hypothetical protein
LRKKREKFDFIHRQKNVFYNGKTKHFFKQSVLPIIPFVIFGDDRKKWKRDRRRWSVKED